MKETTTIALPTVFAIFVLFAIPNLGSEQLAFAETDFKSSTISGDDVSKNPLAKQILERIEIAKQRIAELKQKQIQLNEQQKFIEEQREIAKQKLSTQLDRMNKDYEDYTPKAAFTNFVSKMPEKVHSVYWGMFEYQSSKVQAANDAMNRILENGGSYAEARQAFNDIASTKRVQLIEMTKNLNIENGLADDKIQQSFDRYGKLPRTE